MEETQYLNLPVRCQNHATQLVNVSLLACVKHNLLSRLYGVTVFLRNLGYWLRMRRAFSDWISERLNFSQEIHSKDVTGNLQHSPALLQMLDFVKSSRSIEAKDSKDEHSFDRKAAAFLEMWNGDVSNNEPCHRCSHSALPPDQRHCRDRAHEVDKMVQTFLDLFMILPSVPAPNKWTTMFGCIDFVLSGIVIHRWLPEVFRRAFRDMTFAEFDELSSSTDCRFLEQLSFHAVNGRRHDASLAFMRFIDVCPTAFGFGDGSHTCADVFLAGLFG